MTLRELTLRVAIVGSGPAGIYTAEALTKQSPWPVEIDLLERLPTPFGLVRYGVAPDHTSIRSVAGYLRQVLESPGVRFLGGVELGADVSVPELLSCYDAVVYCTGAMADRRLGIPGEDLPGSVAATRFVNWYCGHPDVQADEFHLDAENVVVIGAGNVAIDVVRIMAKHAEELRDTDVPQEVFERLVASRVRQVRIVARRGPEHAKFAPKELRELGELRNADIVTYPDEVKVEDVSTLTRQARGNVDVLRSWSLRTPADRPRRLEIRFWWRPVEILGRSRVEGVRLERTRLDDGQVTGTGETETIPADMVIRSVGYQSTALPGVPLDPVSRTVPHVDGRVADRQYVAGWLKRGPTGVIGTNRADAVQTVRRLLAEVVPGVASHRLDDLLAARGRRPLTYLEWRAIEAAEVELATTLGRGERVKLAGRAAMLAAIGRPDLPA